MLSIILDILVVAIVVASAVIAWKKGFIKTLFSLVGGIAAVALAVSFSAPVASWLDSSFVGPTVRNSVLTAINGAPITTDYDEALEKVDVSAKLQEMPDSLRSFLESINIDVDEALSLAEQNRANSATARAKMIMEITASVTATISKAIALIGLIIIFFLLLLVASMLLNAIFKLLPFGRTFNRVGGLLFGIARGILLVMIFSIIVYGLAYSNTLISFDDVEKTWLLRFINGYNPILKLFI